MKQSRSELGISVEAAKPRQITEIARLTGIRTDELRLYGNFKGKVALTIRDRLKEKPSGKLICISGMTPTKSGEGKTCTSIGLTQALGVLKKRVFLCLREPSLAPIFGNKGGATGSGYAQILPSDEINLHFTGDIHAVEIATNVLAAVMDNHRHHGNKLDLDPNQIYWRRTLDICDRQLRQVIVGGSKDSLTEQAITGFDITASSEIMAILSLASSIKDLKDRLARIIVGLSTSKKPVTALQLKTVGAMAVLLKDAIEPNLVQTMEGQPVFVHTGPFANVSHGNNSILATQTALKLADYVVTESGFGTDLGLEKMFDIVSQAGGLEPSAVVIVVTIKALKSHSKDDRLEGGFANLEKHVENVRQYGIEPVIALNRFPQDQDSELKYVGDFLRMRGIESAVSNPVAEGGPGSVELAETVLKVLAKKSSRFKPLYDPALLRVEEKCELLAKKIYGADGITLSEKAQRDLEMIGAMNLNHLPVNILKTPLSLSDDENLKGAPKGWKLNIRSFRVFAGAGYIIAVAGKAMLMPGLPAEPMLEKMDVDDSGRVIGV